MKTSALLLGSVVVAENETLEVLNDWAVADYPDMDSKFTVPLNRWGGNSPENANFAPRADKKPTDLKFWSKFAASIYKEPTKEGQSIWQAGDATWFQKYRDEMSTEEQDTGAIDADGNAIYNRQVLTYNTDYWEFAQTATEKAAGWERSISKCGRPVNPNGPNPSLRQQDDPNCPNVIIINTDDMAWADLSVNNPSKVVPTPNLDRLVSKGINFRDGHSCTARCAPSRYCLMSGRHAWRRGDYHYKPMYLEHGRKIVPQMFKRAGYRTFLVGKAQPTEAKITKLMSIDHYTECKKSAGGEENENEERKRRSADDFQRLVYTGGVYDPAVNDLMFMGASETTGEPLSTEEQKMCWYGAATYLSNKCTESWSCLAKKSNPSLFQTCVNNCLKNQSNSLKNSVAKSVEKNCPSRVDFCTVDKTDYKNFMLQEGVTKWGYDTGFNSFSYCCYPGAAFFRDDYNIEALRSYGMYVDIRGDPHMYSDNRRVRDDWMGKNMQYLIGRTGVFKQYQGEDFRPWSATKYSMPKRYTNLQLDENTNMPCAHLNEETKCTAPQDVDQCDWMDALKDKLEQQIAARETYDKNGAYISSDDFDTTVRLLEASYFFMHRNQTLDLSRFARLRQLKVLPSQAVHSRKRRAPKTDEEKIDATFDVLDMPEHDGLGGHFERINPTITAAFFRNYVTRSGNFNQDKDGQPARRQKVVDFVDEAMHACMEKVNLILSEEISCTARRRRETPAKKPLIQTNNAGKKSFNPNVAMKMVLRGSIKDFTGGFKDELKPNASPEEQNKLRENYEFSSNMYKFIYGEGEDNADNFIQGPQGAEDKPRHFHSKEEAKTFVDDVTRAFLQYQGLEPEDGYDDAGVAQYTGDQMKRFKLWEFAHSKNNDGTWSFKAPRTQPSFDSREVLKTFNEESIKNFVEAKHHIEETNQPFFMYCAYRAPHRPFSHIENYDYTRPGGFIGKAGEQLREFDDRIGLMMNALEELKIADNTFVMFTSDNGPDGSGFANQDYAGHIRFGTFRGKKASVYEGGHRVPFLVWWPKGIHQSLWGSNYDLPVSQLDLFATFADMIKYPLPGREQCTYAYDAVSKAIPNDVKTRLMSEIKREKSELHKLSSDEKTKAFFVNDASAKWTLSTIRTKCTGNSQTDNPELECPCDNWTNDKNPLYNAATSQRCMNGSDWQKADLSKCRCYPAAFDCEEGFCFTDIEPADKLDFMSITGGRDKINEVFYKTNAQGNKVSVGAWDEMTPSQQKSFRAGLADVAMYHQFLTLEDKTGLVIGFDGCMAEDSHSFYDAFQPSNKVANQGKWHRRPAEIFAGKLGDLSLRMGRYKLVRFNPPKDRRTGPNAQHLRPNDQSEWPKDPKGGKNDKWWDPANGSWTDQSYYQKCEWAPPRTPNMLNPYLSNVVLNRKNVPEDDESNTRFMCQRDFYYELWDLHTNPGEKNLCSRQYSEDVWEAVTEAGGYQAADNPRENEWVLVRSGAGGNATADARGLGGNTVDTAQYGMKLQEGKPEKHPDPAGIGSGKESTPVPGYINDCCLLDYGDYVNTCNNGEGDHCVKPKNDPIKSAGDILRINANKIRRWLAVQENWEQFANKFADQLKFHWAKRDTQAEKDFYENLRDASAFDNAADMDPSSFAANNTFGAFSPKFNDRSLKVPYVFRVPVFSHVVDGKKVSCINVARQTYVQEIKGVDTLKPNKYWTSMVASDADDCEEDDSFISNEWDTIDLKTAGKFAPGGKLNNEAKFREFFAELATTQNSNALAGKIDAFFDENFRSEGRSNVFVPDSKTQAYKTFTEGALVGNTKRFPTVSNLYISTNGFSL